MSSQVKPLSFATIGLGGMGGEITRLALDHGHKLLGAVDIGDKLGKPVREFADHPGADGHTVSDSIASVIAKAGKPDIVVITASVGQDRVTEIAVPLLEQGIQILTLEPGLFEGVGPLAQRIDAAGKKGGASFLASGIQDTWWVHLPAVAAGSNHRIKKVMLDDFANIFFFMRSAGEYEAGVKLDDAAFAKWREKMLAEPPVQGGPLRELALRLGFTPGKVEHDIAPIRAKKAVPWPGAETTIEVGEIDGALYSARFSTAEGVEFLGHLTYQVAEIDRISINRIIIDGDVKLTIEAPEIPAFLAVALGLVRRFPDIIAAAPGIVRVAELDPISYQRAAG